ncbi:hypothetical protein SAMN04487898_122108 [Pedobacter sp. ok626]|nr:hypothetical protein SAMN04487898_122108 [Pedobacter sp. ok626]
MMATNREIQVQPSHAGCLTRSQWLDNKSRMMGDHHVRIYENLRLKCLGLLNKPNLNKQKTIKNEENYFRNNVAVFGNN